MSLKEDITPSVPAEDWNLGINPIFSKANFDIWIFFLDASSLPKCSKCLLNECKGQIQARKDNGHIQIVKGQKLNHFISQV